MKKTMMMLLAAFVCLSSVNAQKKHNYDTMDLLLEERSVLEPPR